MKRWLWQQLALPMRRLLLALFLFVTGGPAVIAENDDSALKFFLQERDRVRSQRPTFVPRANPSPHIIAVPIHAARRPVIHRNVVVQREVVRYSAAPPLVSLDKPVVAPSFFTAVLGDSLGVLMAQGLQEAFADRPEMAFLRKARESSGLVREDYFDWPKGVREMLAAPDHLDLAIIMIGSNDHQAIRDGNDYVEALTPRWREIYGDRVEALAAQFRARNIQLIWVGMPVMKNERMAGDMIQFNEIYRERAGKAGAIYVDIWEAFVNDANKYDAFGPDVNGATMKLRSADGVHLTKAGARKLAHFVEAEVKRAFDSASPKSDPAVAALMPPLPAGEPAASSAPAPVPVLPEPAEAAGGDINVLLRQQIGVAPAIAAPSDAMADKVPVPGLQAVLPLPAEPASLFIPVRPAAGAVALLTGPSLAPDGELVSRQRASRAGSDAQALIDQAFVDGRLAKAKPGRADHFAWPQ